MPESSAESIKKRSSEVAVSSLAMAAMARSCWKLVGPPEATPGPTAPGLYDVLDNTLEIMQVRITRSRMAGDPPELLITPRLPHFAFLDLHRAEEAIEEGRRATRLALSTNEHA